MALARIHVWSVGEILTASDLNNEFNNPLNNALSLISPLTGNLDAGNNQIINLRVENVGSDPVAARVGRLFFNTGTLMLGVDDSNFIRKVPTIKSTSLAPGDVVVVSSANVFTNLGIGSSGQVLTVTTSGGTGGGLAWATPVTASSATGVSFPILTSQGGTAQDWSTQAQGNIPYFSAAGTMATRAQVQTSQGGHGTDFSAASTGAIGYVSSSGQMLAIAAGSTYRLPMSATSGVAWSTGQMIYPDTLGRTIIGSTNASGYIVTLGQVRCDGSTASRFVLPVGTNLFAT